MATKSLWYLVVVTILALMVIFVANVYFAFLNSNLFGFISLTFLLIVGIVIRILMRRGAVPKPSTEVQKIAQKATKILFVAYFAVFFILMLLIWFFGVPWLENRVFIYIILIGSLVIIFLLVSFMARRKYKLENRASYKSNCYSLVLKSWHRKTANSVKKV
jgi:hypothetical protein